MRLIPMDLDDPTGEGVLDAVVGLLGLAYGTPGRTNRVTRFLAVQPGGWVNAFDPSGTIVGCGGCVAYPDGGFGWIGLIATHPDHQGKGIGRLVTEWLMRYLRDQGCAAGLDASDAGAPLYRKLGYRDHGYSALAIHDGLTVARRSDSVRLYRPADFELLVSFDARRFGADRSRLLRLLIAGNEERCWVSERAGQLDGYGIAQAVSVWPIVADEGDVAASLIAATLTNEFPTPPTMCVNAEWGDLDVLATTGFTLTRRLVRQHRGIDVLPGQRSSLCAQVSFGEG